MGRNKLADLFVNDVYRSEFFRRWVKISAVQNIEMCYRWAESLKGKPDLIDDVIFCLQYVLKMKRLLNKERAATIFPTFVYSLKDTLSNLKIMPLEDLTPSCLLYMKTTVETMVDLVESFDLTWKDSIETMCLLDLAYDFLLYPHWKILDDAIIIKGLKLLNTAISRYMSPDLVLLIYHKEDSNISQMGSLLYAKCHDDFWEIRDSALEVVYTLSINANTKFPAYVNILLNSELPQLVVSMALNDGEGYVRATAFKCLQELVQILEIWDIFLDMDTFLDNILDVFEHETEGIVRKEVATLIYKIHKFQNFPDDILPRLYDVMTHAAIGDLHWEVKYNALDFWFNLWEEHLIHQGMIDRMFPSHTFSKEHKKIVALNEVEVRKRIIKVLNQLSRIGCLHVMKWAVKDDCDLEVSKKATSFTFVMLRMFKCYKIPCENVDLNPSSGLVILQNLHSNQQLFEPITPTNSGSASDLSPASIENLGSSKFTNCPFFDPVSPISAPYSPDLTHSVITPPESISLNSNTQNTHCSPAQNQSLYGNTVCQQTSPTSTTEFHTSHSNSPSNQIAPSVNPTNGIDTFCGENVNLDPAHLEDIANFNSCDPAQREHLQDKFLNSIDVTLLQSIYNPTDRVTHNTTQMKTKMYLAPSQYLKFVYNDVEAHATQKAQWINSFDEFDSLLDDILKEYDVLTEVNSMDCY